ncbi:diguanylate cyclase (GGDEF) domain-containing protein [Cohaesibacter gelatinilyticus]|uniref:diguanylate cyclase n=2 Tax=Cohaesibacter gelatinilyticus TaxID=372072 RepID=A0A285N6G0_9HYPH|nr:diguanylate cyclase (GGDEF) domain-containing protein [Cohaesibacter gelatinilyticus]
MDRTDQNRLDQLILKLGSIQSWQKFMIIGGILAFLVTGICASMTFYVMGDLGEEALSRALILSTILPLALITFIWTGFNRVLVVMTRANQNLRRAADVDSLTRLCNRAAFYRRGREIFDQTILTNLHGSQGSHCSLDKKMSLIMIDIDHFKRINDQLGHLAGDQALCHVSKIISNCCREADMPARWGGEEFAILLEDADRKAALNVAERIRQVAETEQFVWEGKPVCITLSAGVTEFSTQDQKLEDIVLRADLALYHAKAAGRNKVHAPYIMEEDLKEKHKPHDLLSIGMGQQISKA